MTIGPTGGGKEWVVVETRRMRNETNNIVWEIVVPIKR